MANYIVSDTNLTAVADAIRAKTGGSASLEFPDDFVSEIGSISGGSSVDVEALSVTENGTYTAPTGKAYSPVTVAVEGGGSDTLAALEAGQLTTWTNADVTGAVGRPFFKNTNVTSVSYPNATSVLSDAFNGCSALTTVDMPNATEIRNYAFNGCSALENAKFGSQTQGALSLTYVGTYAFYGCTNMECTVTFTGTVIGDYAFYNCKKLRSIVANSCTNVSQRALYGCLALTSISLPLATKIDTYAFYGCENVTSISLPAATSISSYAFADCESLTSLELNSSFSGQGQNYLFRNCTSLQELDLKGITSIASNMFNGCTNLNKIILRKTGTAVSLANQNAFTGTPFASGGSGGTLYVPNDLITSYQSASNWSTILGYPNNQIKKIEGSIYE